MRKVIYFMSMSLDGYIEGPDRDIDWHQVDDDLHHAFNEQLAAMGGFLHGRVVHELMADFWPTADQDPAAAGPTAEFAVIWRNMPKYVYSRTLQRADWNTTVVHDVVPEEVMALKEQPGGDLALGGAGLAASFAALDLIDEYWVYVHPVLIGRGKPMFPLTDTRTPCGSRAPVPSATVSWNCGTSGRKSPRRADRRAGTAVARSGTGERNHMASDPPGPAAGG